MSVTFKPFDIVQEFTVSVRDDNVVEAVEMFSVTFDPAVGETGVAPITMATNITIMDDSDGNIYWLMCH